MPLLEILLGHVSIYCFNTVSIMGLLYFRNVSDVTNRNKNWNNKGCLSVFIVAHAMVNNNNTEYDVCEKNSKCSTFMIFCRTVLPFPPHWEHKGYFTTRYCFTMIVLYRGLWDWSEIANTGFCWPPTRSSNNIFLALYIDTPRPSCEPIMLCMIGPLEALLLFSVRPLDT